MQNQYPRMLHPIERNLARVLIQLRQANFGPYQNSSDNSSIDDGCDYFDDFEDECSNSIKEKFTIDEWMSVVEEEYIDAPILNHLVLDYLIKSGNNEAATKFAEESGININHRVETQVSIVCNEISSYLKEYQAGFVIKRLLQMDPNFLTNNRRLWIRIMAFKLVGRIDQLLMFGRNEVVSALEGCEDSEEKEIIINEFEEIAHSLIFDDQLPYSVGDIIKKITEYVMTHYGVKPTSDIDDMMNITYGIQESTKSLFDAPKLTCKNLVKGANLIYE